MVPQPSELYNGVGAQGARPDWCSAGVIGMKLGLDSRVSVGTHAWGLGVLFPFTVDGPPMMASDHVSRPLKKPSKMGFDEVSLHLMGLGWGWMSNPSLGSPLLPLGLCYQPGAQTPAPGSNAELSLGDGDLCSGGRCCGWQVRHPQMGLGDHETHLRS